jgi:hypothetical protein
LLLKGKISGLNAHEDDYSRLGDSGSKSPIFESSSVTPRMFLDRI